MKYIVLFFMLLTTISPALAQGYDFTLTVPNCTDKPVQWTADDTYEKDGQMIRYSFSYTVAPYEELKIYIRDGNVVMTVRSNAPCVIDQLPKDLISNRI